MEEVLRAHRDRAFNLLRENRAQSREGIEVLVRTRLGALAAAANPGGAALPDEQLEALYREVLDLSFIMFSLGYTMANTALKEPAPTR